MDRADGGHRDRVIGDRYELHERLGEGGAAVVHRATDTRLDRDVAVKLLRDTTHDAVERDRFDAEARLLSRFSHPGLVQVLDFGVEDRHPYLVLELVRGRTLAHHLADGGLPLVHLTEVAARVAEALAHVHAAGVVHRDVKPGNVLISETGEVKLADFGIARLVDDTRHHTRTGMLVGTVSYLAPEQVSGGPVTTAVDVYALGLVLLEALTGTRAYAASTPTESALARLTRQPTLPDDLPTGWHGLLADMTARDPGQRPGAAEVAARLRAPADQARPGPAPVPSRARVPALALAAVVALAVALLGVAAVSDDPGGEVAAAEPSASAAATPSATAQPPAATPTAAPTTAPTTDAVAAVAASPTQSASTSGQGRGKAKNKAKAHGGKARGHHGGKARGHQQGGPGKSGKGKPKHGGPKHKGKR